MVLLHNVWYVIVTVNFYRSKGGFGDIFAKSIAVLYKSSFDILSIHSSFGCLGLLIINPIFRPTTYVWYDNVTVNF